VGKPHDNASVTMFIMHVLTLLQLQIFTLVKMVVTLCFDECMKDSPAFRYHLDFIFTMSKLA